MTHFGPFAQDKSFIKYLGFLILLLVLENTYLEQMARNALQFFFCILETKPFYLKVFTQYLGSGLHPPSKGQGLTIHR